MHQDVITKTHPASHDRHDKAVRLADDQKPTPPQSESDEQGDSTDE